MNELLEKRLLNAFRQLDDNCKEMVTAWSEYLVQLTTKGEAQAENGKITEITERIN